MAPLSPGSGCTTRGRMRAGLSSAARAVALLVAWGGFGASAAWGQFPLDPQTENPVFVDESPAVVEGLARIRDHVKAGNPEQAVKTLQKVLDEHADEFVATDTDPNLFEPVRARVHGLLLASPVLMARYREATAASARVMLEEGRLEELARTRLMTPEGLTAALRLARMRVLGGQFDGAALLLLELVDHPDRAARSKEVAEAGALAARYQTDGAVRKRLGALIDGGELPALEVLPRTEGGAGASLGSGSVSALPDDLVNRPTTTGVFGDASLLVQPRIGLIDDAALAQLPPYAREMRCWPVVGERAIYFSDGSTVSGFDRVSLRKLWSVNAADVLKLPVDDRDDLGNGLRRPLESAWEEVVQPVLSAGSSLLVAVVGRDYDSNNHVEGVEYLTGFDAETGAVRYAVPLRGSGGSGGEGDEQLADGFARGPLVSDGRVVVVNLLKRQNQRRLVASVLVGFEAATGKRLWARVVGSEGVLPYYRQALTDNTVGGAGVVYRYDRLGVIGAYTIGEGRPLWVRRLSSKVAIERDPQQEPWLVHRPLVTSAGVVVMTPDRDEALVLEASTGRVTARRKAAELREPEYLAATATHLVAVGKWHVGTVRLDQIETGPVKLSRRFGAVADGVSGIRGRVTVAGDRIVVPTVSGLTVLDVDAPGTPLRTVALDAPGSPLALPEGLMIVDDARVHMYCTWAVAAAHLRAQVAASPTDAGPATELLKLAERASRAEEVLPAADSALAALAKSGAGADESAHRASIVATLLRVVNRSIGLPVDQPGASFDSAAVLEAWTRADAAAKSPWDRVAVVLALGDVCEKNGEWDKAAAAYQRIVQDDELGAASAPGSATGRAASLVAVDRLTRVVRAGGRGAYAEFDKRFAEAEAAYGPNATAEEIEKIVARYPLARSGPAAWLRAANLASATKTPQGQRAQARALERGVQAAERAGDADPAAVGELNGTLVRNLLDRGLVSAAADALARSQSRFPGVALSVGGVAMAGAEVNGAIQRELAGARRWPRVGEPKAGGEGGGRGPQVIDGWVLMEPMIKSVTGGGGGNGGGGATPPFVVLHKGDERRSQVALFGLKPGQLAGEAAEGKEGALTELWFSESASEPWWLVRTDARGALFFVGEKNGGRLVRVDAESGKVAWRTEPFGSLFPTDPPARFGDGGMALRTSIGGEMRSSAEIVIATDDRTVCMVERAGRCAAVDADSGQVLWASRLPVTRIADATVSGGQLVAVGEHAQVQADGKADRLALFDARTGTQLAVTAAPVSGVRYIRTTSRGDLIMGAGGTIVAVNAADLETARTAWTLTGHAAANAWEAWLMDDRLFLLSDDRSLWEVSAVSGAAPTKVVDVQGRLDARTAIAAWQTGGGNVVFATGRGLVLIDGKGGLAGADAVNALDGTVLPVVTEGGALLLSPPPPRNNGPFAFPGDGGNGQATTWTLHRVETAGAQLLSSTPISFSTAPLRMAAIDGRIAISTAAGTIVIDAPVTAK